MGSKASPVTGILEEDMVIIDFGRYEGKSVLEISERDPRFYRNLITAKTDGNFVIRRNRDKTFRLYCNNFDTIQESEVRTQSTEIPFEPMNIEPM